MIAIVWAKIWKYIVGIAVLAAAIAAIFLKGRESGKASNQAKVDEATQDAQIATQTAQAVETRHDIDQTVAQLPEAPAQTVATADHNSALGQLRDDGWVR
jgi:hypothetical protein